MSRFSIDAIFKGHDRVTAVAGAVKASTRGLGTNLANGLHGANKMVDQTIGGLRKMASVAKTSGLIIGAGLGFVGHQIISAGADFEEAITAVGAVGLQTRDQVKDLEKEAKRLGATTKFTATEAANAMEVMARAGFKNEEILSGVGGVLSAAAASGLEMAEVADHVSNVMKGMGLEASEAGRVADVLALASSRTNSSIGTLGESMKNLSPVARQMGVSLEDAVGMVALLQDVGLDASEAGTATATMMTKLSKPTDAMAKQMKKMGVAFKDAKGDMLPPLEVFANMSNATKQLGGNMDQVAFFADLVGLRGQKAALNLKDLFTSDKGQALTAELREAKGAAEAMSKLRMDNLKGDWTLFGSAVDAVKVALFDLEGGPLRGVIQSMTKWVSANQELIVSGVKEFIQDFRDVLPEIVFWGKKIGIVASTFLAVGAAIKVASSAMALFNLIANANPISLIALAIIAAVGLIIAFWPEITAFFSDLWAGIKDIASKVAGAVMPIIQAVWNPVKSFLVGLFEYIVGLGVLLFGPLVEMFKNLFAPIITAASLVMAHWAPIKVFFADLWGGILDSFNEKWELLKAGFTIYVDIMKAVWGPVLDFFIGLWGSIKDTFFDIVGPVLDGIGWAVDKIRGLGRDALGTGGDEAGGDGGGAPQVIPPADRAAQAAVEAGGGYDYAEVSIKDETGRAAVTKKPKGDWFGLQMPPSGAFQ